MPRIKNASKRRLYKRKKSLSSDGSYHGEPEDQGLPSDEAGRMKVKKHYAELLGIRIEKLKGQMLNREKISKSIEGVYFICAECKRVCHNLDEGLVQDLKKQVLFCKECARKKSIKVKGKVA